MDVLTNADDYASLVGIDSQSLANDPLAKQLNALSEQDKKELAQLIKVGADELLAYYKKGNKKSTD